jgi:beta-glucosidase
VAQAAADQGTVLLANDSNQLPLARNLKSIAIIGAPADVGVLEGGGSSEVWPVGGQALAPSGAGFPYPILHIFSSPLQAIRARAGTASIPFPCVILRR